MQIIQTLMKLYLAMSFGAAVVLVGIFALYRLVQPPLDVGSKPFDIVVDVSPDLAAYLREKSHGLSVYVFFSGRTDEAKLSMLENIFWMDAKSGTVGLGRYELRLPVEGGIAKIPSIKIAGKKLAKLANTDFTVLININPNPRDWADAKPINCGISERPLSAYLLAEPVVIQCRFAG